MNARRSWLIPLSPLYGAIVTIKRRMYRWGWLKRNRLSSPVISIGSVSAGGAGKTPMVAMLAGILRRRGYGVSILTRGYGRASNLVERVEPFDDPAWHGDEPVLLAQRTGVPVFAGVERYRAGLLAEQEWRGDRIGVHLLDDGFQHLRLSRNIDIVLLTVDDLNDVLLPAGNLREPLTAVSEADVVVVREDEAAQLKQALEDLQDRGNGFAVWTIRRTLSLAEKESTLPTLPLAFCGIARPENFSQMLKSSRYEALDTVVFPDHYRYQERDISRLLEEARQKGANGFVTTEKDAVKLTAPMLQRLEAVGPVILARLQVELINEKESMAQLISMVSELDRRKAPERS
ncbi:tetraacyldisaccharide 4'-kinase [Edaphobacter albus]|uniref:tetraacyldisaccharide 4'-kinase n=1 Tax=Edaphobacter sp. 4G125 TaxID=2763071 RepID=UPI001647FB9D|nr:tetraacyldisaccharide 4'-kinase [Edaphobacter sp. 4G125]QNI37830.1 tetraacyldisaccharide 4'-kinase [Edaphobacter sp. 4G125]